MSIRENVVSALVKEIISLGSVSYSGDIDDDTLQKMLADVDVAQAIQLMTQSVTSKEWKIETDVPEYFETAENIQERFNNFNMVKLLENVLRSEIYKKSIFEIIYGKDDTGGTVIDDLVLLPNKYIKYNKDNGWMIKTRDSEIVIAKEPNRFLVCINEERLDNLQGSSDLLPLVPVFKAKEHLESKLNAIIEKYGDIITVFAYEPAVETDPPEVIKARQKDVEAQAKDLKNAKGKDVLAVPSAGEKSLDDFIKFIKLDDLKPEIYQELLSEKSKAVQRYLLGSTLVVGVDGNSGNRALGEVHKEQQNYKIESKVKKIRDWIQKLIELDSVLYGYDPSKFYFKFVEEIDEKETLELEDKKAKTMTEKVNSIVKIMESGYAFTKDKIAEMLGVDVIDLVEVEKTEVSEFAKGKKKLNINKINEKRKLIERNQARFDRFVENNFKRWQKDVLKAVREKIEKAKDISDFYDLNFNYENILEDLMLMSTLQGFDNAAMVDNGVTEFANTRTKTKNAALDNFLKKHPALYTDVEKEMDYSRQKYFWIKKVTDVNVTEKIFKQMSNTLENGGTFKDWKKDVDKILSESGLKLNEGYLKTVFRTNMNHAYNAGIHLKVDKYKERYPYYRYCGILDGREQQHTKELDGKIFKVGTPEADKYFPPNGFNCRCYTVSLTEDEVDPSEVVSGDDIGLDVGSFADNIGDVDYIEILENNYKQKVKIVEEIENEVLQKVENRVKINYKEADDKIIKKYENKTFEVFGYNPGDGELTKKEVESFKRYTGDEYTKINKYLRGEMKDDMIYDEYYGDYYGLGNVTSDIKRVLSKHKLEDDLKLYRGVSEPEFNYLKENNTFNQFISTSFDENIANDFMDEVENSKAYKVIVNAPKGTQGLYINGKGAYEDEKEFILNVGQKYKILKFEDGILHLEVMKNE
ncbi:ADP-ribosyltransferase [Leptotrichia shahii]|uniref:phage portal protein family protein n=1 Tax=Leptotrichia shahii TaxID=157691 RepID=UPI0028D85EA1|nr:ADP-ribosyltransferase [Leptotrichia shahii]